MANSFMEQMAFPKGWLGSFILKGMNIGHRKLWERTLQGLSLPEEGRILDIGCGGGGLLHRLLREYPRLAADGLDVSETSVKESRRKNRCYGSRCTIAQGEATALPYEDGRPLLVGGSGARIFRSASRAEAGRALRHRPGSGRPDGYDVEQQIRAHDHPCAGRDRRPFGRRRLFGRQDGDVPQDEMGERRKIHCAKGGEKGSGFFLI